MEQNYELTTARYLFELTKLFFESVVAYYFKRDDEKLEKLYYEVMDIQEKYIEKYCDEEDKQERFKEKIYELLDIVVLKEQNEILRIHNGKGKMYRGIKLRENIINDIYTELWLIGKELFLYIFSGSGVKEEMIYFDIEEPYLLSMDQVYYALKKQRIPGLLTLLYEKQNE